LRIHLILWKQLDEPSCIIDKGSVMNKVLLVLFLVFFSGFSFSDEDAKKQKLDELLTLMNADALVDSIYSQMDQMVMGLEQHLGVKPSEKALFDEHTNKTTQIIKQEMSWEKMKGPMIAIYMKHYTESEIADMVAFYKTQTGQSMIKKMPLVMNDTMIMSQSLMKDMMPKMQALSLELKEKLAAVRNKDNQAELTN